MPMFCLQFPCSATCSLEDFTLVCKSQTSCTIHIAPEFGYTPQVAKEAQHGRLHFECHVGLGRAWNTLQLIACNVYSEEGL